MIVQNMIANRNNIQSGGRKQGIFRILDGLCLPGAGSGQARGRPRPARLPRGIGGKKEAARRGDGTARRAAVAQIWWEVR
jgi:hypothetical protein